MTTAMHRYTLDNITTILFAGFDYKLPDEVLENISNLALQVGSPDYVKTPVFQKRENPLKSDVSPKDTPGYKKNKRSKGQEITNDDDWQPNRAFQPTKIEGKVGLDSQIDTVRAYLNKLTDKNYIDMRNKIIEILDKLIVENITADDMSRFSSIIFEIASNNRFYSKMYAELYSDLSSKYEMLMDTFETNFRTFTDLFNIIEYVDPATNYDRFCEINKTNEKRKSLASFYLNLMANGVIPKIQIINIIRNLLAQIYTNITIDDKKNVVEELTETVGILYKKELCDEFTKDDYELIDGHTISEAVKRIANSKVKDFKSLTNKSLFKFMDLIEM
jgi:hypothetical protein